MTAAAPAFDWDAFDDLPEVIRRVVAHAPFPYTMENVWRSWTAARDRDGRSPEEFAVWLQREVYPQHVRGLNYPWSIR